MKARCEKSGSLAYAKRGVRERELTMLAVLVFLLGKCLNVTDAA
jgi:hypothetical protein